MTAPTETEASRDVDGPVAIVGIGCRYADARGPEEIWEIIRSGRNTVRDAPQHRIDLGYDVDHFYDPRPRTPGRISSKKGGFLEHPELFDPAPFGIAPRDALTMDPQQRLMVEVTWDALEDAGILPSAIAGERVAVIVGYMAEDYSRERTGVLGEEVVFRGHDVFTVGGMSHAVLSGRIAFLLGVTGPSFTLDTACSSSLIATHLACQSLRRGEADMALAGGANLFLSPEGNIALSRSGMLSMSGACRAFDAGCDGFVRAEGAGVVVLKRLADAIADDDPIYAVIRGSGISTDGRDGGHMMAPGRKGQAQAMRDAYAQAGVDPADIQYVETHGTGTMIGDPVEIGALADVMGPGRDPEKPLRVASIKGHLGHTESASGVAGLIQACLAIRHRTLPKQLHFETPNPAIPWDDVPIRVQTELAPWPEPGPALVGVNSFGISGTNAHVVLESPPERAPRAPMTIRRGLVLPLSAHDPLALAEMTRAIRDRLEDASPEEARDVLFTLGVHREQRPHRIAFAAESLDQLRADLAAHLEGETPSGVASGTAEPNRRPQVVMVFPGQGSQYLGMGRALLADEPAFAEAIDRIDAAYRAHVDWSLRERLETNAEEAEVAPERDWTQRLDELQPVLVAFEIALAELWQSWGVAPDRVIGQSMGEIAAAYVAGALDLETVARLACHRGRIVAQATGQGGMALVSLSRADVERRIADRDPAATGRLEIAGVNAPSATIVAGDRDALAAWVATLDAEGIFARMLDVDFASHCFQMDPLLAPFRAGLDGLASRTARIPIHSTVDGETKTGEELGADYWVRNLRSAVALDAAVEQATAAGGEIFVELSAHPTLSRALSECATAAGRSIEFVGSLTRDEPDATSLARAVGALFVAGAGVDFARFGPPGEVTRLPLYAYQRERYWFSERTRGDTHRSTHPLLGAPVDYALAPGTRLWSFLLDADTAGFASDHRIGGRAVLPTSTLVELGLEAARSQAPEAPCAIEDLRPGAPLALETDERRIVQVVTRRVADERFALTVASRPATAAATAPWTQHGRATLHRIATESPAVAERGDPSGLDAQGRGRFDDAMARCAVAFGPRVQSLRELLEDPAHPDGAAVSARLQLPRSVETEWHAYRAHPAMIETALQLGGLLTDPGAGELERTAVDILRIGSVQLPRDLGSEIFARVTRRAPVEASLLPDLAFDCHLFDRDGAPLGEIIGIDVRRRPIVQKNADAKASHVAGVRWQSLSPSGEDVPVTAALTRWVVVSDDVAQADLVAAELRKRGAECRACVRTEDLAGLTLAMSASDARPWGLLVLAWGEARDTAVEPSAERDARIAPWAEAIRRDAADAPTVWIATRGLLPVTADDARGSLASRRVAAELDAFTARLELDRCRFFDASPALDGADHGLLARALCTPHAEHWVAARAGELSVPRLALLDATKAARRTSRRRPAGDRNVGATRIAGGRRDHRGDPEAGVGLTVLAEPEAEPGQIVVAVEAASLCRLDTAAALVPDGRAPGALGHDFVGRVVSIGADVADRRPGDLVLGVRRGSLRRRLVVEATATARVLTPPSDDRFDAAAIAVLPALVARHALDLAARVAPGEAVLVDAGSGPIAHALLRHATALGADACALARSTRSAARLERAGFAVERLDSASEGAPPTVSVVVSDASGTRAHALAERLAPGGRYVDLRAPNEDDATEGVVIPLGPNRTGSRIDTVGLVESEPALTGSMLHALAAEPSSWAAPATRFPIAEIDRALRYVAQNRHDGPVTIDFADVEGAPVPDSATDRLWGGRFDRVVLDGDARAPIAALAEALRSAGVAEVEIGSPLDDEAASLTARTVSIRLSSDADRDRGAAREARLSAEATQVFVSLRAETTGERAADRGWVSQLWLDRLTRPESAAPSWHELSIAASADADAILALVTQALERSDEPVLVDIVGIDAGAPSSTFMADLASPSEPEVGLLDLSPEARRERVLALVRSELGTVLGLAPEQCEVLAPTRRLDSLGLDSLMSLELFVGLGRTLGLDVEREWFTTIPALGEIASTLAERVAASTEKAV